MEPLNSDDEHDLIDLSGPPWQRFEQDVAALYEKLAPGASIEWNKRILGTLSGRKRQVDVLLVGSVADQEITIAIECKRYARRLGIGAVDEFVGKLLDLDADRGVLCSMAGFTVGAEARADGGHVPKVLLLPIEVSRAEPPDYSNLLSDCPNDGCWGEVAWQTWRSDSGERLEIAICRSCGTWVVRCSECGEKTDFVWDDTGCYGCDASYSLGYDRKYTEVESAIRTVGSVETVFGEFG